jgi:hypothetical protein
VFAPMSWTRIRFDLELELGRVWRGGLLDSESLSGVERHRRGGGLGGMGLGFVLVQADPNSIQHGRSEGDSDPPLRQRRPPRGFVTANVPCGPRRGGARPWGGTRRRLGLGWAACQPGEGWGFRQRAAGSARGPTGGSVGLEHGVGVVLLEAREGVVDVAVVGLVHPDRQDQVPHRRVRPAKPRPVPASEEQIGPGLARIGRRRTRAAGGRAGTGATRTRTRRAGGTRWPRPGVARRFRSESLAAGVRAVEALRTARWGRLTQTGGEIPGESGEG